MRAMIRQPTVHALAILLSCLTVGGPVLAQAQGTASTSPSAPQQLERVVLTASGTEQRVFETPFAVSVVDAAELQGAGAMLNLSEALVRVPGLVVNLRHNYAQDLQLSSRGFGARASFGVRGLRLYTDGIPASGPDGQGQVSHFDLAGAQRIEVLRGPFSALYGNSSGGAILLHSAAPTERRIALDIDAGSAGLQQGRFSLALPLDGGFSLRAQVSRLDIDGFRPHSSASRELANLRLGWEGAQDRVLLVLNSLDQPALDPLGLTRAQLQADPDQTASIALPQRQPGDPDRFNTRKLTRQHQAGASWRHRFEAAVAGPLAESQLSVYRGERAVTQWQSIPVATQANERQPGGVIDFDRGYQGLDGRLLWRWRLADERQARLVTGLSLDQSREDRRGFENFSGPVATRLLGVTGRLRRDEVNRVESRDAYAQAELELAPDWVASAGLRGGSLRFRSEDRYIVGANPDDSGSLRFAYRNPVAALQWRPNETLNLYASLGRGFEAPGLAELAYRPDGQPGFNSVLQPQTSQQWELGAKWRWVPLRLSLDAALFQADSANEIGVATNSGGRASFRNVGRTRRQGLELELGLSPVPDWRALVSASWLDARYRDSFAICAGVPCITPSLLVPAGNRIAGTLARSAYAELGWTPQAAWELALEVRGQGRMPVNDVNADFAAGFGLAALRARWRHELGAAGRLELLARVDNLADRRVVGSVIVNEGNGRFFEPAPGRSWLLGLRWSRGW